MRQNSIVIDACSLLNLCATESALLALRELGVRALLLPQVAAETLYVYRGGQGADAKEKCKVDLPDMVMKGTLVPDSLASPDEESLFVELAGILDDGEAACCAVAMVRRILLLTDDGQAIKEMAARGYASQIVTTPDIIKRVSESLGLDRASVRRLLVDIQERSRYAPSRLHPLSTWWESCVHAG